MPALRFGCAWNDGNPTHHTHCSTTAKDESQNGSNGSDHYLYFRPSLSSTWNTLMTQLVAVFHYEPMRTALASSVWAPKWYSTAAGCLVGRRMNLHRVWRSDNPESQIQTKLPRTLNLSQSSKVQAASDSLPPWGLLLIRWSNWSQDVENRLHQGSVSVLAGTATTTTTTTTITTSNTLRLDLLLRKVYL